MPNSGIRKENNVIIIVGVSDMKVSNDINANIVTYSLGSCIGMAIYDPVVHVGGIFHFMLPESKLDTVKAKKNPYMFADSGTPLFFKTAYKLGAKKQRMRVILVGGAHVLDQKGFFNIGKRNHMAVRQIFWKNKVMVDYEDVGGNVNRTIRLAIKDGRAKLKVSGREEIII